MADTVYSMNQYIYGGKNDDCMKQINHKLLYLDWKIDSESSPYYRDILIAPLAGDPGTDGANISFENNESYYVSFGIPRNLNYNLNFSVKLLVNYDGYIYNASTTKYQFIKYLTTRRTSDNGTSNSLVCLYELKEEPNTVRSAARWGAATDVNTVMPHAPYTPDQFKANNMTSRYFYEVQNPVGPTNPQYIYYPYVLYHNRNNDRYWMFGGTDVKIATYQNEETTDPFGDDNILRGTNDIVLNWVWQQESVSNMAYYKMIITPQSSSSVSFNYILLQMERISEDADIITDALVGTGPYATIDVSHPGVGQPVYGRFVDLDQATGNIKSDTSLEKVADTFKLYKLTNLNAAKLGTNGAAITRFGIWSHPELLMAVNGEEIQIGSSGYYELNDFEVKKLCVVADGVKDMFTLDYQYLA